jgi:MFS family permease
LGAIVGTILAAMMGDWFGRRITYSMLCVAAMGTELFFFLGNTAYGTMFLATAFLGGICTASFYGWLPLYLPELFATKVRATGQGFGFNFGRILAAIGTLYTGALFAMELPIGDHVYKGYPLACSVMSSVYLFGLAIIWLAPETRGKPLPE